MVEYRLYHDNGKVLFYTCEAPEGTFITVDRQTYAEGRYDVQVVDGQVVRNMAPKPTYLIQSTTGTCCHPDDVSVITTTGIYWRMK
jgi:hypothetical protein